MEPVENRSFFAKAWDLIRKWAKAEVAFLLPMLSEWMFDALTRLDDQGYLWAGILVSALTVWFVPNKTD